VARSLSLSLSLSMSLSRRLGPAHNVHRNENNAARDGGGEDGAHGELVGQDAEPRHGFGGSGLGLGMGT